MTEGKILNFPAKEKVTADSILSGAMGILDDCIILGVTKEGNLYSAICAENSQQVIYLLRMLEHLIVEEDLS